MKHFQTKFYLTPRKVISLNFFLLVFEVINSEKKFKLNLSGFNVIAFVFCFLFFIASLFFIFYETASRETLLADNNRLKKSFESEKDTNYKKTIEKELLLNQTIVGELIQNKNYYHKLKSLDKVFDASNGIHYIALILALIGTTWSYSYLNIFGVLIYKIMFVFTFLFFCVFSTLYDLTKNKKITGISIGAGVILFIIFSLTKEILVKCFLFL